MFDQIHKMTQTLHGALDGLSARQRVISNNGQCRHPQL